MKPAEKRILDNIEIYGFHVTAVVDPDKREPDFTYSVGLKKSYSIPEVILFAVNPNLGHSMICEYRDMARKGIAFEPGYEINGILDSFSVCVGTVTKQDKEKYMLSDCWLYGSSDFDALQIVYPTTTGIWPWDSEASEWFRKNQPILNRNCIPAVD